MPIMKKDLRVEKTETAIENAFLDLVEERGFEKVRLVDVAERANVNRNTIYLRYGAKEDIVGSILAKTYEESLPHLNIEEMLRGIPTRKKINRLFSELLSVIQRSEEIYRIFLTDDSLAGYINRILDEVRKFVLAGIPHKKMNSLVVEYVLQGVYGIIKQWIVYDSGGIEENARLLTDLVSSSMRYVAYR